MTTAATDNPESVPETKAKSSGTRTIVYDDATPRNFAFASVLWGIVGMLVGVIVALQMAFWQANISPFLTFGRLRPLHTNAVIFAFVGNMLFAGVYYSTQRLLKTRMANDLLSKVHFWGWQLIIVSAALTLPLGLTQGKEYAELIWPIDIAVTLIWVVFAVNMFWTIAIRNEKHLYVAIWFYIATIVTIAILYIVNNLALPISSFASYGVFGGVQDALVQWWYGHNAVAFFLTTPILGIMYYFVPKAAERPVYSYRLSIVHFWSLVFLYIWAGPHHLLNTSLPEWAQTLGMIFSLMLWAPSWGGMINGLLTLRGAWERLRTDPVLKFFAAGVTFYGMATFEGPMLSIRSVSALAHYTDWIIGHVHAGALGWNGMMAAGMLYWMIPRLYGRELHSRSAANAHFWTGTFGILLYVVAMYMSGVTQGLMWRAEAPGGGLLYPTFVETIDAIRPLYWLRLVGGTVYLLGFIVMAWNLVMTVRGAKLVENKVEVPALVDDDKTPMGKILFSPPVLLSIVVVVMCVVAGMIGELASGATLVLAGAVTVLGTIALEAARKNGGPAWHRLLEGRALPFTVLAALSVLVGGIAEIVPTVVIGANEAASTSHAPYTALEIEGRDVYVSEGCYVCHSQMIRPFTWETARYGAPTTSEDSIWDHPFQWGSKRTGPDLAREGGRYPDVWHARHMEDPRSTSPGSIMPPYPHLRTTHVDYSGTHGKLAALQTLGIPYTDDQVAHAEEDARAQAEGIVHGLEADEQLDPDSQLVALIAYLQRLGHDTSSFTPARDQTAPVATASAEGGTP